MAREGLLLQPGGDETPPLPPEPETPKSRWDNFWYYHKWHVVFAAAGVILVALFIKDLNAPRADFEIGMITEDYIPEETVSLLQDEIAKYAEDLNGDGRVMVQVNSYPVTSSAAQPGAAQSQPEMAELQAAARIKLDADLAAGQSFLFLTDETSFEQQQKQQKIFARTDGTTPPEGENGPDGMRIPLSRMKAFSGLSDLPDRLGLSLRVYQGSAAEGKQEAYWRASVRLFQKLQAG